MQPPPQRSALSHVICKVMILDEEQTTGNLGKVDGERFCKHCKIDLMLDCETVKKMADVVIDSIAVSFDWVAGVVSVVTSVPHAHDIISFLSWEKLRCESEQFVLEKQAYLC